MTPTNGNEFALIYGAGRAHMDRFDADDLSTAFEAGKACQRREQAAIAPPASPSHDGTHNFNDGADRMTCVLCGYLVREGEPTDPTCPGVKPASPPPVDGLCRNTSYRHGVHSCYADRYNGYCLHCADAGVPDLVERIADLERRVERLTKTLKWFVDVAESAPKPKLGGINWPMLCEEGRAALDGGRGGQKPAETQSPHAGP
jgi:hypothetical protein